MNSVKDILLGGGGEKKKYLTNLMCDDTRETYIYIHTQCLWTPFVEDCHFVCRKNDSECVLRC